MEEPRADGREGRRRSRGPRRPGAAAGGVPAFPRLRRVPDSRRSATAPKGSGSCACLDACQRALENGAIALAPADPRAGATAPPYFVHESAYVDEGAEIGAGTKIWHFSHVMKGARIGERVHHRPERERRWRHRHREQRQDPEQRVGLHGAVIEDDVFLGPSCVLTNVTNPRSQVNRHSLYETTHLKRGCTIGANATIVCGVTVGRYAFVGAGSVVTKNVPDFALVVGNPARQVGWMSRHGHRLDRPTRTG